MKKFCTEILNGNIYTVEFAGTCGFTGKESILVSVETAKMSKSTGQNIWRTVDPNGVTGNKVIAQARKQV